MKITNIQEAKTHLSRLLEEVQSGKEIVISKAGKPIAKLVPIERDTSARTLGGWEGKVWIADDFDELPAELLAAFYGTKDDPDDPLTQYMNEQKQRKEK